MTISICGAAHRADDVPQLKAIVARRRDDHVDIIGRRTSMASSPVRIVNACTDRF